MRPAPTERSGGRLVDTGLVPIYEYRCESCGEVFEKLILQRQAPDPACPTCEGGQVQRLISRLGLAGTSPVTGDALFESDKLTFTQRQGLKGRVPEAAKHAYKAMRAQRQAEGKELGHAPALTAEELAELDQDDPRRLEDGHYHDDDHVHLVDDHDHDDHDHTAHDHDDAAHDDASNDRGDGHAEGHAHTHDHAAGHDHGPATGPTAPAG